MNCARCGYSLEGLAPDGVCPECALEVSLSANPPPRTSEFAAIRYVHTAVIALLGAACIAHLVHPSLRWNYGPTEYDSMVMGVGALAGLIGGVVAVADILFRKWGPRLVLIVCLTIVVWIPVLSELGRTR